MKKILMLVVGVMLLDVVSGLGFNLQDSYRQGETIIVEVSGVVLEPISKEQVELVRNGYIDVGFEYDVKRLGENYFIWLTAPLNEGNYSLVVRDVVTYVNGNVEVTDYSEEFSVGGGLKEYSIKPGFVFTSKDFAINVMVNSDEQQTIRVDFPETREVILSSGEHEIKFSVIDVVGTQFISLGVGDYSVPALIYGKAAEPGNGSVQNGSVFEENKTGGIVEEERRTENEIVLIQPNFAFNPKIIQGRVLVSEEVHVYPVEIINTGESRIDKIAFQYDDDLFFVRNENFSLEPNESLKFELEMKNFSAREGQIREVVTAYAGEVPAYLLVKVDLTMKEDEVSTNYLKEYSNVEGESLYYCSELDGILCTGGEICSGEKVSSLDGGVCCLGSCKTEGDGGWRAWIGYLILGIVVLVLLIIFIKYRKTKPDKGSPLGRRVAGTEKSLP